MTAECAKSAAVSSIVGASASASERGSLERNEGNLTCSRSSGRALNVSILPLSHLCRLESCPTCGHDELYYPDRQKGTKVHLLSLDRGHELELPVDENFPD